MYVVTPGMLDDHSYCYHLYCYLLLQFNSMVLVI